MFVQWQAQGGNPFKHRPWLHNRYVLGPHELWKFELWEYWSCIHSFCCHFQQARLREKLLDVPARVVMTYRVDEYILLITVSSDNTIQKLENIPSQVISLWNRTIEFPRTLAALQLATISMSAPNNSFTLKYWLLPGGNNENSQINEGAPVQVQGWQTMSWSDTSVSRSEGTH